MEFLTISLSIQMSLSLTLVEHNCAMIKIKFILIQYNILKIDSIFFCLLKKSKNKILFVIDIIFKENSAV